MPRNTTTGRVLEEMVIPSLIRGGYSFTEQADVGKKVNGRKHKVDVMVNGQQGDILISLKWQQSSGTAEQKVPFEVINLIHACKTHGFSKAYLVLGGVDSKPGEAQGGWTLRKWYLSGALKEFIDYEQCVDILLTEDFVVKANQGAL
jgi:hypothetical protein